MDQSASRSGRMTDAELIALATVVSVQRLAGESDLRNLGHLQEDPRKGAAYERLVAELVERGVLPTDDIFAPKSRREDEVAGEVLPAVLKSSD